MKIELTQFNELKSELDTLVKPTLSIKVTDFPSSASAIEAAKSVKALQKRIEAKRKELVGPLNDQVKRINDFVKDIMAPLDTAESHLKRQLTDFEVEQEKLRDAERKAAEAERVKREAALAARQEEERAAMAEKLAETSEVEDLFGADEGVPDAAMEAAALEARQAEERARIAQQAKDREYDIKSRGVANTRKIWKCDVEDLDLVPKEFLIVTLNQAAVIAAARAGVTKIPGVKIWQETSIAIGANTSVARALR